jgi:hypothetical protein
MVTMVTPTTSTRRPRPSTLLSLFFLFFFLLPVLTIDEVRAAKSQLHVHMGMINGSFSAPNAEPFSVSPNPTNLEIEFFLNNKKSLFARMTVALSMETGKAVYVYSGIGMRYYFKSTGNTVSAAEGGTALSTMPKWRYYYGWDLGVSRMIIAEFGPVLNVTTTMLDFGGHMGIIKQMGKAWGLEVQMGLSFGYGMSNISGTGQTMRVMIGGAYYF